MSIEQTADTADGLTAGTLEEAGLEAARFGAMEELVASGELKKITGIVVARHGKLVYERYFEGFDRASLMNTRSASKTVTSMLIGSAIDQGFISGADATLLSFFPDKPPVYYPDPRKAQI